MKRFLVLLMLVFVACGSGGGNQADSGADVADDAVSDVSGDAVNDTGSNVDARVDAATDAGIDTVVKPSCFEDITDNLPFQLFPDEGRFVLQVASAFDGEAVWLAWSAMDERGTQDPDDDVSTIRAARIGCDRKILVEPFSVFPTGEGNCWEPDIVVSGDTVMIVWHEDYQGYYARMGVLPIAPMPPEPVRAAAPLESISLEEADPDIVEPDDDAGDPDADTSDAVDDVADIIQDAASDQGSADAATDSGPVDAGTDVPYYPNDNMRIYFRTFKTDGTPVMATQYRWMPPVDGVAAPVNNWIPRAAALPDGRFVIASTWANPNASVFQVVAQRFNADGSPEGDLIYPWPRLDEDQQNADVAVDSDGNIRMTWGHSIKEGEAWNTRIASMTIPAGSSQPIEDSPVFFDVAGDLPNVAITPQDTVYTAFIDSSDPVNVVLVAETAGRASSGGKMFGNDGDEKNWIHFNPVLNCNESGNVVALFREPPSTLQDKHTDLMLYRLAYNGTGDIAAIGAGIEVNAPDQERTHDAQGYYKPSVTHVGAGHYLVTWAEPEKIGEVWHYKTFARFLKP
ncbi:MAG TPA: hypothetical protein PKH54_07100 [Myxococcota bacterium]|nr:hypothetical protein [Myxococcota bacterium]HOC99694.1 hypothetical protein [Myxococcota bacterium]HOH76646.1 hypothetical protein [Myxococcota bacterium]